MSGAGGRRAFVVVIDACGVGALPDAAQYGDAGTHTLAHVADAVGGLDLPELQRLGLGSITPVAGVPPARQPVLHGRLHPLGPGKDSTTGHWELMGVVPARAAPTFPDGFPADVVALIRAVTGRDVLCNRPYDGVGALEDFGAEHLRTGALILYTSQDSVLQLAAHVDVLPTDALHEACATIRRRIRVPVGRVIARPFRGQPGAFARTDRRKDYALPPPAPSYLDALYARGVEVHAVGKVGQVFAGRGVTHDHPAPDNPRALRAVNALLARDLEHGLVFANLIDTDQVYGHRKDVRGFHRALKEIDAYLATWHERLDPARDLLVVTADHGVDPKHPKTDHTREHVPLLAAFAGHGGRRHDGPMTDVGASVLRWLTGDAEPDLPGEPFVP